MIGIAATTTGIIKGDSSCFNHSDTDECIIDAFYYPSRC